MSNLNLSKLKSHRSEILKAEIGTLLYNLGKTHAGINNWRSYFPNAQPKNKKFSRYIYYCKSKNKGNNTQSYFKEELTGVSKELSDFVFSKEVKLPDNSKLDWKEFFCGAVSKKDFINKIFFRGCENINSGIDKGSPKDENQLSKLWISNAFGTYKKSVDINNFDKSRLFFFSLYIGFLKTDTII